MNIPAWLSFSYRNREQEMTHLKVNCYISDLGHLIEKYIVTSVYKNYQKLKRLFCIANAVISLTLRQSSVYSCFAELDTFHWKFAVTAWGLKIDLHTLSHDFKKWRHYPLTKAGSWVLSNSFVDKWRWKETERWNLSHK